MYMYVFVHMFAVGPGRRATKSRSIQAVGWEKIHTTSNGKLPRERASTVTYIHTCTHSVCVLTPASRVERMFCTHTDIRSVYTSSSSSSFS